MIIVALQVFYVFVFCFLAAYLIRHYIFTLAVLRDVKNPQPPNPYVNVHFEPVVSILIPAHNEDQVLGKLMQRLTKLTYPKDKLDIIIIDDASSDQTGDIADEYSKQNSFVSVIHRQPKIGGTGKAAAINASLRWAKGEIVLLFDADYLPRHDIVEILVKEFADPKVGAVQGRPVVQNESENSITRIVTLERIGGYRVDQEARSILWLMPQFGGTVGGFRRSILADLGGFDENMLTEDTDLTFHIYLEGYKIRYAGNAECYEEAVNTLRTYWRQRHRWARGHMQVCCKHTFNVLKSKKLTLREKLDGLLLLYIYFMPVLTLFASLLSVLLIVSGSSIFVNELWFFIPISIYSFMGNFAPFFEIGIGVYLDGRKRLQWLIPLLIFSFLYNMLICTAAFIDVFGRKLLRRPQNNWAKTKHLGYANQYFPSRLMRRIIDDS